MARRAQHVRLQRLQRHWLRALVSAHESARRLAAGLERVSASARTRTRARLLRAWRRAVHAMHEREEHAARHGARLEPRLCVLAGLRRWGRWIAGLARERMVESRRGAAARMHWLEAAVERWRRAARYLATMGLGGGGAMGAFGQRRTRRAGRSELWKAAGKASSAVPAAIHSAVPTAIHTGGGTGGGGGNVATRRVALLQALQGNSLFLRARGCLMRWRAATRSRRVLAKWLWRLARRRRSTGGVVSLVGIVARAGDAIGPTVTLSAVSSSACGAAGCGWCSSAGDAGTMRLARAGRPRMQGSSNGRRCSRRRERL